MVPVHLVGLPAEVSEPAADLGVRAVGLAAAAGPLRSGVAGPDWPVVAAAAGVVADSLSLLLAWPLLPVWVPLLLAVWLPWLLLWLQH